MRLAPCRSPIAIATMAVAMAVMAMTLIAVSAVASFAAPAANVACSYEPQGDGRVDAVVDGRTLRLDDGREIRLAGIEIPPGQDGSALAARVMGRSVSLLGPDDTPDRYGRQSAIVEADGAATSVQADLLRQGLALFSGLVADRPCATELAAAEAEARKARRGTWNSDSAIKNAERPGDISTLVGQFVVIEGKVLSVRQAGATIYVNFGRRWTESFAATISRRMIAALEASGLAPKSLENRRVRVRGWVELRGGPRIDVLQPGQVELAGE
ncbi:MULTISPECIES: thermonuclease family protein [unclassified Bradyrhizobium]|uniref:thermonuclease family protein n=1 Tax=unclassified Bradyrhizobium TaxID=2631580 RepID=UPI0020132F45|nr:MULTISPECIES: thermonuclease family protein [unclassified Bradyrhizobium]